MNASRTPSYASNLLAIVAVVVLGLSAGSMLNEAVVLVSFWRSIPAQDFLDWYADNADRRFRRRAHRSPIKGCLICSAI